MSKENPNPNWEGLKKVGKTALIAVAIGYIGLALL